MIKFGVIGAGHIAHAFSKACKESGIILQGIASRDITKAKVFQDEYGYKSIYDTYEALYNDPLVDAIYVATPHGLHYEHMMEILNYKKHIICEKAFTLNALQAKKVFDYAKVQKVFVMEAMWTRFLPVTIAIKDAVQKGIIGEITNLKADFAFSGNPSDTNRLLNPNLGGGALLDVGIYPLTYANLFLGIPTKIESKAILTHTLVDGTIDVTYYYPNAIANLHASITTDGGSEAIIYGKKGYIHVPNFWKAQEAFIYDLSHHLLERISIPHKVNGYEYEILSFIEGIENKTFTTPYMNESITLNLLKQMDEIRKQIGVIYPNE